MSDHEPSDPARDRPRLAEALASLKEGLRETADPFYDSWKVQRRSPPATPRSDAEPAPTTEMVFGGRAIEPRPAADWNVTSEIAANGGLAFAPDENERGSTLPEDAAVGSETAKDLADGAHAVPEPAIAQDTERLSTDIDIPIEIDAPRRLSVPTDTVRVRVIRYRVFPTWALVAAVALVVFSASLFAIRASLPMIWRSHPTVLAGEDIPHVPDIAGGSGVALPASRSPSAVRVTKTSTDHIAPTVGEPSFERGSVAVDGVTVPVPSAVPAGKLGGPSQRRLPGAPDFFRDPGF